MKKLRTVAALKSLVPDKDRYHAPVTPAVEIPILSVTEVVLLEHSLQVVDAGGGGRWAAVTSAASVAVDWESFCCDRMELPVERSEVNIHWIARDGGKTD